MLLRGIRWRRGASLLTVLTAAIAVGAAVIGPLYLQAAGDSLTRSAVVAAPTASAGITLLPQAGQQLGLGALRSEQRSLRRRFALDRWYGPAISSVVSGVALSQPGGSPLRGDLIYRSGICAHLRITAGSCRLGPGDVLVSSRSNRLIRAKLGGVIEATVRGATVPLKLWVVGIYTDPNPSLPYWWGNGLSYFPYGYTTGPTHIPEVDGLISSAATALRVPAKDIPDSTVQLPLQRSTVGLSARGPIEQTLREARHAAAADNIELDTRLPVVLAGAAHQQHLMITIIVVAAVQLVLLAVWVLTALLLRSAELRRSELRIARLRGFPLASIVSVTVLEPALLCGAGAVVGVISAWVAVLAGKGLIMHPGTVITVGPWVWAALLAAIIVIAGVLAVSTTRVLRDSRFAEDAGAGRPGIGRARLISDVILLVLSAVALVALATSGALARHSNPIASAAPGLLALGTTVVAVHVVLLICRRGIRATDDSRHVASALALRQVVRRPSLLREGRVLIVALCLACFATAAWSIARSNRHTAADFTVGADTVVNVTPQGAGLQQAVDRVDPKGRFAMAAVQVSSSSANLLGVQASRMAAAMSWPAGLTSQSVQQVSRLLTPHTIPQITLGKHSVVAGIDYSLAGRVRPGGAKLDLSLWVFSAAIGTSIVNLGELRPGRHFYSGQLAGDCPGGCRLTGIGVVPTGGQLPSHALLKLELTSLTTGSAANGHFSGRTVPQVNIKAGSWRPTASGVRITSTSPDPLRFVFPSAVLSAYESVLGSLSSPMVSVADYPVNLPGVAGKLAIYGATASGDQTLLASQGIDDNTVSIAVKAAASTLPRIGSSAAIVDLQLLTRAQTDPAVTTTVDQVWLGPAAPADAVARLRDAGLRIDAVQRASAVFAKSQKTGNALAYDFMLFATIVALLAAMASTLGVLGSSRRQRTAELTALWVSSVPRRTLGRSLAGEAIILALTALFGAAAGAAGTALAAPSLPQLGGALAAPLSFNLPWLMIVLVAAVVVAVIAASTAFTGAQVMRQMSPSLLRSAPDDAGS